MFDTLTKRLNDIFTELKRRGKLSEKDVDGVMREVRLALLEADVHFSVVKQFVKNIKERAVGHEVSRALNPAQQIIRIVHEELIRILGEPERLDLSGPKPRVILLAGLQGSGKTTAAAKLAKILRTQGERVLLVAADPYRPAAIDQLIKLGSQIGVEVFSDPKEQPPKLASRALDLAKKGGVSVMIIDTAGRSQLDDELMKELKAIGQRVDATETLLVVDAMIGQEALNVAKGFHETVNLSGMIMTKMDGDARGGAAISIRSYTGIPIKYLGTGEGIDALEVYDPERLASRVLGMGDIIGLIQQAESNLDQEQAMSQAERMMKGQFNLEDFANQLKQVRNMGPIQQIMDMMPGNLGKMAGTVSTDQAEGQLKRTEAILSSMTITERRNPSVLNASRRRRIAKGSGVEVQDVNRVLKQFRETQKMIKTIQKTGGRGLEGLFR
ncbi:MAG: signal recognition particle protein [Anaerolineaceae bacterium]|nr:signal recognition particle protein [Anaerolineaceae bacterium]